MSTTTYVSLRNKKAICSFRMKKVPYLLLWTILFFLFLHENIYCGYSFETPCPCTHNICFHVEIKKKYINWIPTSYLELCSDQGFYCLFTKSLHTEKHADTQKRL